jgi:uncharacterized protein (TIGR01777 family)
MGRERWEGRTEPLSRSLCCDSDYSEAHWQAPSDGLSRGNDGRSATLGWTLVPTSPRILISGASGLIGAALVPTFEARGSRITRLVRTAGTGDGEIEWSPAETLRPELVSGFDAVIHLAGESVVGLWTKAKKARILHSRVLGTGHLSEAIAGTSQPPHVFISASATGYYGNRGDEVLREDSSSGEGFLPDACRQWEAATKPAEEAGIRTVRLRTGIVLSSKGGALKKMLPVFRIGLGGKLGSGRQWMSWIHIQDLIGAIHRILDHELLEGPVNLVAPEPVRNAEFTEVLGAVLSRPAVIGVPALALRLMLGEMAEELFLASQRVEPSKLIGSGYRFEHQDLRSALPNILHPSI